MNRRVVLKLGLIASLLLILGVASVLAGSAAMVTGGFHSRDYFGVEQGWFTFNVHENDSPIYNADGFARWKEYNEANGGWRFVEAHPICVDFGEYEPGTGGSFPAATFVVEVDTIRGWKDPAEFEGELMKVWVVDAATPGSRGDLWSSIGPWPPTDDINDYGCQYQDPLFPFTVAGGNLVVHD